MAQREMKAYMLDGEAFKDIPFSAVTTGDLERWFGDQNDSNPEKFYERVGVLFRCLNLRARAVSSMPRDILDAAGQPVDEESLPFDVDLNTLLWQTELSLLLCAQAYWHKLKNRIRLTGVRWLDPLTITPLYSESEGLAGFRRAINGRALPRPIAKDEMVWVWLPTLRETGPGVAPGRVAMRSAGILDNQDAFIEMFFEKGAMPVTLVTAENRPSDPNERNRIKAYLERVLTGLRNAFGIEVLSGSFKFDQLTPPLKDTYIPDISDRHQRSICMALEVPFSLVFSDAANYAISGQDDLHFYTKTINPECAFIQRQLNKRLFAPLAMRLVFQPNRLEIFQQQGVTKVDELVLLYDRQAITVDELRQGSGFAPREGGQQAAAGENAGLIDDAAELAAAEAKLLDLTKWERKTLKALRGGRAPAAVRFESDHLSAWELAAVREGLRHAGTAEEVKAAFAVPFRRQDAPG